MQISSLTKENNILVEKLGKTSNVTVSQNGNSSKKESAFLNNNSATAQSLKSFDELVPDPSTTTLQVCSLADLFSSYISTIACCSIKDSVFCLTL